MPTAIAGSKRLEWLKEQMDRSLADIDAITSKAVDEDRDLTEAEQKTCEARRERVASLEDDLKVEADLAERSATYSDLANRIGPPERVHRSETVERAQVVPEPAYKTPGAYLVDFLTRSENPEAKKRFDRALANQTTAQTPGLLPTPILEPVFIAQAARRPAIEAATLRPLPGSGKTFQRPKITTYTLAGPQTAEKTELPSRAMQIDPLTVTKTTYGGAVNLSWQDRDWTEPAIMDILVSDLAASYAQATDAAFCTYFVGSVTQTEAIAAGTEPIGQRLLAALFAATGTITANTNTMPDTLWVAPDVWGALGSLTDTTGRQLFPTVNPMNALGSIQPTSLTASFAGFRMVVDKNLPAGTAILGDSTFVEVYETVGGQVSAIEPSIMGTTVAFYGYIAWQTIEPDAFVKITGVPTLPLATNGGGQTQQTPHKPGPATAPPKGR